MIRIVETKRLLYYFVVKFKTTNKAIGWLLDEPSPWIFTLLLFSGFKSSFFVRNVKFYFGQQQLAETGVGGDASRHVVKLDHYRQSLFLWDHCSHM